MQLQQSTWPEVETYLARKTSVIVPIGSTEQHGPTGLIGTDYLNADAFAQRLGEQLDVLTTPPVAFGMAQHHLAFAGTISLRTETFISVLVDIIGSLSKHGFRRIVFINGHGGNIAPTLSAMNQFYGELSFGERTAEADVLCKLVNWWMPTRTNALIEDIFGEEEGAHATASEISVTHFLFPESIKDMPQGLEKAQPGLPTDIHNAHDYRARFSDGRIGSDVRNCSRQKGEQVFNLAAEEIGELCKTFFAS